MKKFTKLASMLSVASILLVGSAGCEDTDLVPICYYGVQMTVTFKVAKRYVKLGATYGPCNGTLELKENL